MRKFSLLLGLSWALASCAGSFDSATTPVPSPQDSGGQLGAESIAGGSVHTALGIYQITIDPGTLTASAELVAQRDLQQSELYSLSIQNFMRPDTLIIEGVSETATTLDVHYSTKHPFPQAANLDGPASAGNREDLAVTGRILWLVDSPDPVTYFAGDGDILVNTALVTNADGYFAPGALLGTTGLTANTFPYQLLVDEALDNRVGLSNGGVPTGNFVGNGWSKLDFQSGITGYGIWGQGQTSRHTISLDLATLGSTTMTVRAAIIVKYEDPRGGTNSTQKRANRLPVDDVARFAYRMPHGALDVERLEVLATGAGLSEGQAGVAAIEARVRDWDTRALESAAVHLAGESDVHLVSLGESGLPSVDLDIPMVADALGDTLAVVDDDTPHGGDVAADSGNANDELYLLGTISGVPAVDGVVTGLIRARDITDLTPPAGWDTLRFNLDPSLGPLGTSIEGASFQAFQIAVAPAGEPPAAAWSFTGGVQTVDGSGLIRIDLTTPLLDVTNTSGNYTAEVTWGDGTPLEIFNENTFSGPRQYSHTYTYTGTPPTPQIRTVSVHLIDDDDPTLNGPATPPASPDVTVNPTPPFAGWARRWGSSSIDFAYSVDVAPDNSVAIAGQSWFGPVDLGGGSRTINGLADGFLLKLDANGNYLWDRVFSFPGQEYAHAVVVAPDNSVYVGGRYTGSGTFGGPTRNSTGGEDAFVVKFDAGGAYQWDRAFGNSVGSDAVWGLAVDSAGATFASGAGSGNLDVGGGPMPLNPIFVVKHNAAGTFQWQYAVAAPSASINAVELISTGGFALTGRFIGLVNFGGGPRNGNMVDPFAVKINTSGVYQWDYTATGSDIDEAYAISSTSNGGLWLTGSYASNPCTFGGVPKANTGAAGSYDSFLVELNSSGSQANVYTFGGTGDDNGRGVWVDSNDNVSFAGNFGGMRTLGGPPMQGLFVAQFNALGIWQWQHSWGNVGGGFPYDLTGDFDDNLAVVGHFTGTADFQPGAGITNLTSAGSIDGFALRLESDGTW